MDQLQRHASSGAEHPDDDDEEDESTTTTPPRQIVIDDTPILWNHVRGLVDARVDMILDNAGFELFGDLILADWLLISRHAATVHCHVKRIPWFVSDATQEDVTWLLDVCQGLNNDTFPGVASDQLPVALMGLIARLRRHLANGALVITTHPFWTMPHAYYHLPDMAPPAYNALFHLSDLVIFKGDLNFRKLVYDCAWEPTTPFDEAIGAGWRGRRGMLAVLRTCKSESVVGLNVGMAEALDEVDAKWRVNGRYGMIYASKP